MSKLQIALETLADMASDDFEMSVRRYTGRGMRDKVCLSLVLPRVADILDVVADLVEEFPSPAEDLAEVLNAMRGACIDNMGKGVIFYWPKVPFVDGCEPVSPEPRDRHSWAGGT